jgi:hypothetical protein
MLTIALFQRDYNYLPLEPLSTDFNNISNDEIAKKSTKLEKDIHRALHELIANRNILSKSIRMSRQGAFQLGIVPTKERYFCN